MYEPPLSRLVYLGFDREVVEGVLSSICDNSLTVQEKVEVSCPLRTRSYFSVRSLPERGGTQSDPTPPGPGAAPDHRLVGF